MESINTGLKIILSWYLLSSIFLFVLYGLDKKQAQISGRRIPEITLHVTALAGGFPGGLLGRTIFHHKTRKPVFLMVLISSAVIHTVMWTLYFSNCFNY